MKTFVVWVLAFVPLTVAAAGSAATPAVDFVQAQTLEQVVSGWRPDKAVFVIGDLSRTPVPIDPQALRDLAGELNGKHWAVVIVLELNASALDGRSFALKLRIPLFGGRMPADSKIFLVGFTQKGRSGDVLARFACSALPPAAFEHNIDRWFKPAVRKRTATLWAPSAPLLQEHRRSNRRGKARARRCQVCGQFFSD